MTLQIVRGIEDLEGTDPAIQDFYKYWPSITT